MSEETYIMVPKLRFPEFEDKEEWKEIAFIDVADKNVKWSFIGGPFGSSLVFSDQVVSGIRIIQLQNIGDGEFVDDYKIYTSEDKADELLSCNIYPGDIILSKMGDPVGRACLIPNTNTRYVMCSDGIRLVVNEKQYSKYFIFTLINSTQFRSLIEKTATGSTRKRIGLDDLRYLPMIISNDLEEQQKIADCLSSLDDLISAQNQKLEALKTYKKGMMQQLFPAEGETVPQLRFPEFKDSGDWENYTVDELVLKDILFAPKDGNHGNIHPKSSEYVRKGIPFIMASDLKNGTINFSKCANLMKEQADNLQKGFAKSGDVLLSHKGTVGEVVLLKTIEFPYIMLTPQVTYYRIKDKSKLLNKYLATFFNSEFFQNKLKNAAGGGTRAYIGIIEQGKLSLKVPTNILEQQKIADCLSSLDEQISAQKEKIAALKQHKKGLMQQLFPGR